MYSTYKTILSCYLCIVLIVLVDEGGGETQLRRARRFLSFRNTSKAFLRINIRVNMIPWAQIFAQAVGFRMNWDEPPDTFHPYHHLSRRALYDNLELLLDKNDINGFHCIRRAICETNMISKPEGVYFKILKMIFKNQSMDTDRWHRHTDCGESCDKSINYCPLSMLQVSPYTDLY